MAIYTMLSVHICAICVLLSVHICGIMLLWKWELYKNPPPEPKPIKKEGYIMALSEARKRANAKYNAKAYEQIPIRVPKGKKKQIQEYAEQRGETTNGFINRLIDEAMEQGK